MNTSFTSVFSARSRAVLLAIGLGAAGTLAWAATAGKDASPSVSVSVDPKPLQPATIGAGTSFAPVVKKVAPSVVKVEVTEKAKAVAAPELPPFFSQPGFREFFGEQFGQGGRGTFRQPPQQGLGSGVIVSGDGYVLTNSHVVKGADTIKVTLGDGRELTAKVVGTDPQTDLAVIKIDAKELPAITFSDSDKVEVGDIVLAVGNPFGIGQTVTSGMVSGLGRATLGLAYEDFIQTDAAINPGNSGGALVDAQGRLVGVNTAILSRSGGFQGIGFAIPANLARNVMEQLVSTGKVVRGYFGVSMQEIDAELAKQFDLPTRAGALVADVVADSPAEKAGLKPGDIITELDGKPVRDSRHVKLTVANFAPGQKVQAEVLRDGKKVDVEIQVTTRPSEESLARGDRRGGRGFPDDPDTGTLNGVGVGDLDRETRREFDVPPEIDGALVTSVEPNSPAAAAGLQPGDVIQEINRRRVANADDAVSLTETAESKKTLLRVWSQRGSRYIVVDETEASSNR